MPSFILSKRALLIMQLVLILAFFSGCETIPVKEGPGTLKILVADAPFPLENIEEASVVIYKVELRTASDTSGNPFEVIMEDTMAFNLLELRNGVIADLLETEIASGSYDLIRLYIDSASIALTDGSAYGIKIPGGKATRLKLFVKPSLTIEEGQASEVMLDFNLAKSFVVLGNPKTPAGIKGFIFKPVVRAINLSYAGTLEGYITDAGNEALKHAEVWIEAADTIVSIAYSDADGYYAIPGIMEGNYEFYATSENYDTVMVEGIEIIAAKVTSQNAVLTPLE